MRNFLYIFLVFACIFSACSQKKIKKVQSPPVWYFEHIENTNNFYGYGSDQNEAKAKDIAKNDLLFQLRLKVQTQMQLALNHKNMHTETKFPFSMPTLALPNVKLVRYTKVMRHENIYYVRAEISKSDIAIGFKEEHRQTIKQLEYLKNLHCLKDLNAKDMNKLEKNIKYLHHLQILLQSLGEKIKAEDYSSLASYIQKPKLQILAHTSDERYQKLFYDTIYKELAKIYNIDSSAENKAVVFASIEHGVKGSLLNAAFSLYDCKGTMVYKTNLSSAYNSRGPYENTRYNMTKVGQGIYQQLNTWLNAQ